MDGGAERTSWPEAGLLVSTTQRLISSIAGKVPLGPLTGASGVSAPASKRGCWAVDENADGTITVCIPRNLELFADDYQAIAACAALESLGSSVRLVDSDVDWPAEQLLSENHRTLAQFFAGVAHGLRYNSSKPYQKFAGAFGHGVAWVAHEWFTAHNVRSWVCKGSPSTFKREFTGSPWSLKLPPEILRLESFLRRAARCLDMVKTAPSWAKTSAQLRGNGIKKDLPWSKTGILQSAEAEYLRTTYSKLDTQYKELCDSIDGANASMEAMVRLPERCEAYARAARDVELLVDKVSRGRFAVLEGGKPHRQVVKERREPIGSRISSLDMAQWMSVFHPLFLRGRHFSISEAMSSALDYGNLSQELQDQLREQFTKFASVEKDPVLRELSLVWFEQALQRVC